MFFSSAEQFKEFNGYVIDDVWYPRVTSIINIKAKPALYRFYAEMENFSQGEAVKKQSASEGTLIHEAIEKILMNQKPLVDPNIQPAIDAFLNF